MEYKDDNVYNLVHQRRSYDLPTLTRALDIMQYRRRTQSNDLRRPRIHVKEFGP